MSRTDKGPRDALKWVSVAAALAATATAEYNLAVEIGMHEFVAPAVPIALDAYVLRALQRGREVFVSVLSMVGVNAASHLEHAGMIPLNWGLTTAVAAIAPLVLWRVHALKTTSTPPVDAEHADAHTEHTEHTEHGDAHNVHPYGFEVSTEDTAREHTCYCGATVWGDLGAHQRAPGHPAEHAPVLRPCECAHQDDGLCVCESECARTCPIDAPDWLQDAQGWLRETHQETKPVLAPAPVPEPLFAPYVLDVDVEHSEHSEHTDPNTDPVFNAIKADMLNAFRHLSVVPPLPVEYTRSTDHADAEHVTEHAPDHDSLNLGHVSTGVLEPADTRHMERARVLMARTGGVPTVRALKGLLSTGTPVAQRVRAALRVEHANAHTTSTPSTDGDPA